MLCLHQMCQQYVIKLAQLLHITEYLLQTEYD